MENLITKAEAYARQNHEGQFRKGEAQEPYVTHVAEVASRVARYGGSESAIAAAWLHDVVEDCDPEIEDIENLFGSKVAKIVAEVTDDKSLSKQDRKARQVKNAPYKSEEACLVKWADKICNLLSIANSPPPWDKARKMEYIEWAREVASGLPYSTSTTRQEFEDAIGKALSKV